MKVSVFISLLFVLASCSEGRLKKADIKKVNYFDSIQQQNIKLLDSFRLFQFNDTAKWLMYVMQCDDSSNFGRVRDRKVLPKIPLGFLKINLTYVQVKNDTLSLLYDFMSDNSTRVEQSTAQKPVINGVMFNTKSNKIIGYVVGEAIYSQTGNPQSRYENPLQPEVITFIKNNKDKLNPWFREEAKRRKIID